jgi:hypothetical protein
MSQKPPQAFYRVQHNDSFTRYDKGGSFSARVCYLIDRCHWVNKSKFEGHMKWEATTIEMTPYISLLDDLASAQKLAEFHVRTGCTGVSVAQVQPDTLRLDSWSIRSSDANIDLPVWCSEKNHTFIATSALREHLRVDVGISRVAGWFAVDFIPARMISKVWEQPQKQ